MGSGVVCVLYAWRVECCVWSVVWSVVYGVLQWRLVFVCIVMFAVVPAVVIGDQCEVIWTNSMKTPKMGEANNHT